MERLDTVACRDIATQIPGTPVSLGDLRHVQLVSLLARALSWFLRAITDRHLHASLVASAGVTMTSASAPDASERGHQHLFLTVDDPTRAKASPIMETLLARPNPCARHWRTGAAISKSWRHGNVS